MFHVEPTALLGLSAACDSFVGPERSLRQLFGPERSLSGPCGSFLRLGGGGGGFRSCLWVKIAESPSMVHAPIGFFLRGSSIQPAGCHAACCVSGLCAAVVGCWYPGCSGRGTAAGTAERLFGAIDEGI